MCPAQPFSGDSSPPSLLCRKDRLFYLGFTKQIFQSLSACRIRRKSPKNKHEYLKLPDGIERKENKLFFQETGVFGPNNRCPRGGNWAGISLKQSTAPGAASPHGPSEHAEQERVTRAPHLAPLPTLGHPTAAPALLPAAFLQLFLSQALSTSLSSLSWDPDTQRSFSLVRGSCGSTGIFIHLTLLQSYGSVCGRKPMWVALVLQEQSRSEGQNPHQSVQTVSQHSSDQQGKNKPPFKDSISTFHGKN